MLSANPFANLPRHSFVSWLNAHGLLKRDSAWTLAGLYPDERPEYRRQNAANRCDLIVRPKEL